MENASPQNRDSVIPKRPLSLKILCIFTLIGSGLMVLTTLLITIFYQLQRGEIMVIYIPHDLGQNSMAFLPTFLLALYGSIVMWKMKRWGFYLYVTGVAFRTLFCITLFFGENFIAGIPLAVIQLSMITLFSFNFNHLQTITKAKGVNE
jgi:hypothetical protein